MKHSGKSHAAPIQAALVEELLLYIPYVWFQSFPFQNGGGGTLQPDPGPYAFYMQTHTLIHPHTSALLKAPSSRATP